MGIAVPHIVNIEDLRALARRRLPRVVFDYLDGGAEGEATLRANRLAFDEVTFRPRHAVTVPAPDLRVRVLDAELSLPILLGPVGYSRLMHAGGDVAAARVAGAAETIYVQSTLSGHRLEDVAAAAPGRVWYQLYLIGGREIAERTI
ncbi:MAG TPA: alpha-hydroxy-acid oxidizing protein, partial [bacterium]